MDELGLPHPLTYQKNCLSFYIIFSKNDPMNIFNKYEFHPIVSNSDSHFTMYMQKLEKLLLGNPSPIQRKVTKLILGLIGSPNYRKAPPKMGKHGIL